MEAISEVSSFGRNIPGLLHCVVIHTVQRREHLSLPPSDIRVHKRTHIIPARTRIYMVRASPPDNSGTISFESDIEDIMSLQHSCANNVSPLQDQSFLHSVGIYVTFDMEGLNLPITHPAIILATCLIPRFASLYTEVGRRTIVQHDSRRLTVLLRQLCSRFAQCDVVRVRNELMIESHENEDFDHVVAEIFEDQVITQSGVLALVVDNSIQNMYLLDFETQSGNIPHNSVVRLEDINEFLDVSDEIDTINHNTIPQQAHQSVSVVEFSDIMPSTLPINNFDTTMLIFDQIINNYAIGIQPAINVNTVERTISFSVPYDFITAVDIEPMLAHHHIPSNDLGSDVEVDKQDELETINLQAGSWKDYLPFRTTQLQSEQVSFYSNNTLFKMAGWFIFTLTGLLYWATISKIYTLVKVQYFLYKTSNMYNQYKRATMTNIDQIMLMYKTLSADSRLRLVEIKSIITAIFYIYSGQLGVASSHLTTLFLTRPISLGSILANGGLLVCHYMMTTRYCVYTCEGKKCVVSNDEFKRLCQLSDAGIKITLDDINESIEIQAGEMEEVASNIGSLFAQYKIEGMHVKDIELANKQFAYMRNVSNVASDRISLMIIILRLILRTFWSYDPLDIEFQLFASDLVDIGNAIKCMTNNRNQICSDRKIMLDVIALHKNATSFMTHARMQSMPGCLQRYFANRYREIDEMCTLAHQFLLGAQQRAEPVCIFIRGNPGSGKSLLTMFLMNALEELDGSEFSAEKCYTLSKDRFFEGYANQKFCNSDDVFQIHNSEMLQNEAERIIRMVNSTPYNLPMAFEAKGTTFFNSQYVFLSSNYGKDTKWTECQFAELKIADIGAIKRRFNLVLERNAKSNANVCDNEYYVAQCDSFPDYVGRSMKPGEIAQLVFKMREVRLERHAKSKCSRNEIRAAVGLPPLEDKEVEFYPVVKSANYVDQTSDVIRDFAEQIKQSYINFVGTTVVDRNPAFLSPDEEQLVSMHKSLLNVPQLIPSNNGLIGDDTDMIVQNGELPLQQTLRRPPTAVEWMLKILPIQLCEWMESPYCKWFIYAFTILVTAIICQKLFFKLFPETMEEQSYEEKPGKAWGRKKNYTARKLNMHPSENFGYSTIPQVALHSAEIKEFIPQSSMLDFHSCMTKTMSRGVALLEMHGRDSGRTYQEYGIGFHLKDGIMITPSHLMLKYTVEDMDAYMIMHLDGKTYKMRIPENTWKIENEDVILFLLPKTIPKPVALYKYLLRASNPPSIHPLQEVYQLGIGFNNEVLIRNYNRVPKSGSINHIVDGEVIIYDLGFTYIGDCQKGHSGSPTIVFTLEGPRIVGMHVGATTKSNIGITYVLCQEWFDELISTMETQSASVLPVQIAYTVPAKEANNLPRFTRIRRSPIHAWNGPPRNIPAKFTPFENNDGEIIDPLVVAMSKLKQVHFESPEDLHEEQVIEYMKTVYPPRDDARLMTYDEAINGVPARGIPSIVGSTSAGYPYCLSALKGKNPYITQIDNRYVYQEEFLSKVRIMEEDLRSGKQISVIWADTLKDETRPYEKVMAGKTRLFTSCPLHYLILVRRYFLDFVGRVQELAATHPVSVGLNPHSLQWTLLYQRMAELKGSIIAGDFSNYDGSVPAFVGKIVLNFINIWYKSGDIDAQVRALLFEHLWNGTRICGDKVYFTKDGNPSGNPLTSIFNSLINMIMCYIILTKDFNLLEDEFRLAMYGDDNIISVTRVGLRVSDFTPHFKRRFNMSYTHFTKVVGNDPYDTMDTIRYLGRSFVKYMTIMRAPLELETILESTYWVRGKDMENVAFISTIRSACLELSHFPMREYNKYVDQILDAVRFAGLLPQYNYLISHRRTWFDYHTAFYDEQRKLSVIAYELRKEAFDKNLFDTMESPDFVEEPVQIVCQSGNNTTPKFHGEVAESRHVEYTERAANEASGSQGVQLGQIQDVAPVTKGEMGSDQYQDPMKTCNMELFQLDKTLDREYLLGNYTWTISSGINTVLTTHYFPQDLFSQTYVAQKINDFRFFRAGLRYSIRLTSNKLLYGSIVVVYRPEVDTNDVTPTTMQEWTGYPHMIVSASAGDTVVFDIPFIYNRRALDLVETMYDQMGRFSLVVLNPLLDISGTVSTANIMVTAQFLNAELFMPHADIASSFETQSGKGAEGRIKSEKGSLSSIYNVTRPIGSMIQAAALTSNYAGGAVTILKAANTASNMLGLSKPRSTDMTSVLKVNPYSDLNSGTGIDLTPTLGMDPENQISTKPNVGGVDIDEMDLRQLCGTPSLYEVHNLGPTTSALYLCRTEVQFNSTFIGYATWLASMFTYVSGSRKVKIYFMASQFHSARVVLYLSDASTATQWQNCYHRIVDIQGDTQVEFTLPYTDSYISSSAGGSGNSFALYITVLSWSQPDASLNTPIYLNLYTAAADDIEYGGLLDEEFVAQSCPRNDFAKVFEPFHSSITEYKQQGFLYGEKYTTIRQIIHRYSAITQGSLLETEYTIDHYMGRGDIDIGKYIGLELFGLLYNFWRGSKRVKFIPRFANRQQSLVVYNQDGRVLKGTAISCVPNPVAEVELPYYFNTLYRSTRSATTQRVECGVVSFDNYALTAAGDDFSFHFIRPPPKGSFANPTSSGYPLLRIFLDQP